MADDGGHVLGQEGEDEDPALTGTTGIEDDHASAVGDGMFDHGQPQ